jgi:hypothetical protein
MCGSTGSAAARQRQRPNARIVYGQISWRPPRSGFGAPAYQQVPPTARALSLDLESAVVGRIFYTRKISAGQFRTFATKSALDDFRCIAQNSAGIGGVSDIKAGSGGLKSGAYDPSLP